MFWNRANIDSINQYYHGNVVRAYGQWRGKVIPCEEGEAKAEPREKEHMNSDKRTDRRTASLFIALLFSVCTGPV